MSSWNFKIVTIAFVLARFVSLAQSQHTVDSLQELITTATDTTRFNYLMELVYEYGGNSKNMKALDVATQANQLATILKDTIRIVRSGRWMGQLYHRLGRETEAQSILFSHLVLAKQRKYKDFCVVILNTIALSYVSQAKYDKALKYNFQSLDQRIELGDTAMIAVALNNIGLVYYKLENNKKAIVYYSWVVDLMKQRDYDFDLGEIYLNLSLAYLRMWDFKNAKVNLVSAQSICDKVCSPNFQIDHSYVQGEIAYAQNDIRQAEKSLRQSYELSKKYGNPQFQIENAISLSRIYILQKRFHLAESYLRFAIKIGSGLTYSSLMKDVYKQFSDLYIASGDSENAKKSQRKYIQFSDSLYNEKLIQNLLAVHVEHEQRANKAKIVAQNGELLLKEEVIHRQKILTVVAGIAIGILVLLILVLYQNNHHKKSTNAILERKVEERIKELQISTQRIQKTYKEQHNFIIERQGSIMSSLYKMKELSLHALEKLPNSETHLHLVQLNVMIGLIQDLVDRLNDDVLSS